MNYKVLFIDDEFEKWMIHLKDGLLPHGFEVIGANFPEDVSVLIKKHKPDIVLLDIWDKGQDRGKPTLVLIKNKNPDLPVVMFTSTLKDAQMIDPIDYPGAFHFFPKQELNREKYEDPYKGLAEILKKAIDDASNRKKSLDERLGFIVGKTLKMLDVAEKILQVAPSDATVLIGGESGTGKELVARAIHQNSSRASGLFYPINITIVPTRDAGLALMDKLFGHIRKQPPWNDGGKPGIFENASGGTVFLDEIGNAPSDVQEGLLRVLQAREVERIGSNAPIPVDVRIIAATNQNLEEKISQKAFRYDLYYRLKVVEIQLPPLRERVSDIPDLYVRFVTNFNQHYKQQVDTAVRSDVLKMFQNYHWPGNIRQLENVIEAAMVTARSTILTPSLFKLESDTPNMSALPININETVSNLIDGKTSWDALKDIRGDSRKEIFQALIERLKARNKGKRPTHKELAKILQVSESNMRRIIKLRDFDKKEEFFD